MKHKFNYVFMSTRMSWVMMVRRCRRHGWRFLFLEVPIFLVFLPLCLLGDLINLPEDIRHRPLKK